MKYKPEYAKEQILVAFASGDEKFAVEFGAKLGYNLINRWKYSNNIFIYKTPKNKEKEACSDFEDYGKFVEWANRRDLTLESRWENLGKAKIMLENLLDDCEIPVKEYKKKLAEIIQYIKKEK